MNTKLKPYAWVVDRDTQYESREIFFTEQDAIENAKLGVVDTHIIPVYREYPALSSQALPIEGESFAKSLAYVPVKSADNTPTELTDDAILELAREFCIGGVYKNDIISFAKALLSRKSESEAVYQARAGEYANMVLNENSPLMMWGNWGEVRKETWDQLKESPTLQKRILFTSPQPSDGKMREAIKKLRFDLKFMSDEHTTVGDSAGSSAIDAAISMLDSQLGEALGQ